MMKVLYRSITAVLLLGLILCGIYPLFISGIGNLLFPDQASGGLVLRAGKPVGARLIGQGFSKLEYFHGRPSSAGEKGYDASNSSGSNLGPTHQKLQETVTSRIETFLKENPTLKTGEIPPLMVTASGSGLDPHISPESAYVQVQRVAQARHMDPQKIKSLVEENIQGPQLGLFGESVVNVLLLNLKLDEEYASSHIRRTD